MTCVYVCNVLYGQWKWIDSSTRMRYLVVSHNDLACNQLTQLKPLELCCREKVLLKCKIRACHFNSPYTLKIHRDKWFKSHDKAASPFQFEVSAAASRSYPSTSPVLFLLILFTCSVKWKCWWQYVGPSCPVILSAAEHILWQKRLRVSPIQPL